MSTYDINSIQSLTLAEGIRRRIGMYLGSDDIEGAYQAFKEIINNSTDEVLNGFGDKIIIEFDSVKNQLSIRDFGRGVPFGTRENGENVLVSIFTKSHTGGKFDDKAYPNSSGLNGIGGTCVCISSLDFSVESYRNGTAAKADFHQGQLLEYKEFNTKEKNGTKIIFIPDPLVFKTGTIEYSFERICHEIKNISYLYKGIVFEIIDINNKKKNKYQAVNGIADLIKDNLTGKAIHPTIISNIISDGVNQIEIAFQWTTGQEQSFVFTNGLYNPEGGTPLTGAKTAITRTINNIFGETLNGDLARTGLIYAINCRVATPSFANQTKTKVNNPELRGLADKAFAEGIKLFAQKNAKEMKSIEDFLVKEFKAEEAAQKARQMVLEHNSEIERESKKKTVLAGKLLDCRYHDENSRLWLCEGLSAKNGLAKARNGDYDAIFPMRGKGKNSLKESSLEKLLENEEYREIMIALGSGYGEKFNLKKLRYNKIIIASDADFDGDSIACLLLTFFYKFYPDLIKAGKIYRGIFPLYQVTTKKGIYYAYNEEEFSKLPKGEVFRMKG